MNMTAILPPLPPAVVCDLAPTALLAITGPDAATFLQGQLSNDVVALPEGAVQYTSYNSPKGRMLANFPLWRRNGDFFALLPGDLAAPVIRRLAMFVLRSKVKLEDLGAATVRFGVGGAGAVDAVGAALELPAAPGPFTAVTTSSGATIVALPGPRFVIVAASDRRDAIATRLGARAAPAPFETWRWLTIRAGVPVVTAATQDLFVPQTANWDVLGGISFGKGCYTGQEIIARTQYLGRLKERLFLFHAPGAVAAGARLYSAAFGDQPCGTVVDAAGGPSGGADLLAVLQLAAAESGDVRLGAPDGVPLEPLPLPYAVPPPVPPRGRTGG
jgi:hypothetical protein